MDFGWVDKRWIQVSISWVWANKLWLHEVSLCQRPVRLQAEVYTLAVSNRLTWLGSPTNLFFLQKNPKLNGSDLSALLGQVIVTLPCQLLGMVIVLQRWQQNIAAPILTLCQQLPPLQTTYISIYSTKLFPSAVYRISKTVIQSVKVFFLNYCRFYELFFFFFYIKCKFKKGSTTGWPIFPVCSIKHKHVLVFEKFLSWFNQSKCTTMLAKRLSVNCHLGFPTPWIRNKDILISVDRHY